MTNFSLDVTKFKPALAIVGAHGLTDLNSFECLPHYAFWALLPLPPCVITTLFCGFSVIHFSEDAGPLSSVLVHTLVTMIGSRQGADAAFKTMLLYLVLFHTPQHYRRHIHEKRYRGLKIAAVATVAALAGCRRFPNRFPLTDLMQRIVIAHITHEKSLRH